MHTRYIARVNRIVHRVHFEGFPPGLTADPSPRNPLPDPNWLEIEISADGCFLYRYTASGEFAGDTWHASLDDAHHQALYEYDSRPEDWREVPPTASDVAAFAAQHLPAKELD